MAKLTIEGLAPWDGSYDFDETSFTNRELHTIKNISGVRAGELGEAMGAGDNDVLIAIAAVALERNGRKVPIDDLWDAEVGKLTFDFTDVEADADPPSSLTPSVSGEPDGSSESTTGSGVTSDETGGPKANGQNSTGELGLAIGATSSLET